jgi:hypothetical protein
LLTVLVELLSLSLAVLLPLSSSQRLLAAIACQLVIEAFFGFFALIEDMIVAACL